MKILCRMHIPRSCLKAAARQCKNPQTDSLFSMNHIMYYIKKRVISDFRRSELSLEVPT